MAASCPYSTSIPCKLVTLQPLIPWHSLPFAATFNGDSGTATEEGLGPVGDDVYAYRDIIATASNSFDVQVTAGCDYAGEGMFTLDWAGSFTLNGLLTGQISANLQPHRQYLPPEYAIGSSGSWEYSYQNQMEWAFDGEEGTTPATVTFTGVYSELGFESYTLPTGESVQAYKLINEYTTSGDLFGAPIPQEGYIEQWWVKGLGLVKEVSYDNADPSVPLMTKTLSSFTGLTPE